MQWLFCHLKNLLKEKVTNEMFISVATFFMITKPILLLAAAY